MLPPHPQTGQHQHDHGTHGLVRQVRADRIGKAAQVFGAVNTQDIERAPLQGRQQKKEPEAQGDIAVDQIGEAK